MATAKTYCVLALLLLGVALTAGRVSSAERDSFDSAAVSLMLAGYEALENEQYEQALEYLERARKLDRESRVLRTLCGEALYKLKRYDEVIGLLKGEVHQGEETDSDLLRLLAYSYEGKGENGKAIDRYKDILRQNPDDEWNRRRMLELLKQEERFQELIAYYKPLLNPKRRSYPRDLFHLGAIYLRIGGKQPASEYLGMAVEADSTMAEAYQLLGNIEESERRWDSALSYYLDYLRLRPGEAAEMLPRVLITARQAMRNTGGAGREDETADSAAWAGFLDELDAREQEGDTLDSAMRRVMTIGAEAIGRLDRAIEINREIAAAEPDDEFSRRSLLRLYYSTGRYEEMIPIYERIVDPADVSYPNDMLQLGALYLKKGESEKGRESLEKSIESDESMARAHQMLGHLAEQHQEWDEALKYYVRFIELEPEALRESFDRLAETSLKAERPELVVGILEEAISRGDTSVWAAEQLGWMYFNSDWTDKAHEILRRLHKKGSIGENGLYILGLVQMRQENYEDAARSFAEVRERVPGYFLSYLANSNALMLREQPEQAREVLLLGLERVDSTNAEGRRELMYSLANVYHELGDEESTERRLQQVLEISPDYAPALNYLGYFYADRSRNMEEAYKLIERALEKDPDNGHYLDSMGWILFKMGRAENALDYIRNSLANLRKQQRQDKEYSEVYEHLGDIYLVLGKTDLAREAWRNSLEIDRDNSEVERKLNELDKRKNQ
ncbi:MAG: tetratricopeptide repeat protein [Candidatus Glassbacteria bacterium]|nr:tetratricopeptide repeat protein [Candidatus Glassbacteria bacterium]